MDFYFVYNVLLYMWLYFHLHPYTYYCQKFIEAIHCRIRSCRWYSWLLKNIMNLVIDVVLVLLKFVWSCQWILYPLNINMAKHINCVITTTSLNYIILGNHTFYIAIKTNPSYVCVSYTLRDIGIHFHNLLNKNEEVSWLYLITTFFVPPASNYVFLFNNVGIRICS